MNNTRVQTPAEVAAVLAHCMPRFEWVFGRNIKTRVCLAHMRCRAAAKDFEGCLGIIPADRETTIINKMNEYAFSTCLP